MLIITNVYQRLTLCQVLCETLGLVAVKLTKKQIMCLFMEFAT